MTNQKRRRGGQPGNTNAVKHGFYARSFDEIEAADLEAVLATGLSDEIMMLRVAIRRVFSYASEESTNLEGWSNTLGVISMATAKLAGLLRTQHLLGGSEANETMEALKQALREVNSEIRCK